jgi:hypothetical protein
VNASAEARTSRIVTAYRLRDAIIEMTIRYGKALSAAAYAHSRCLDTYDEQDHADHERFRRTARRRFRALQRLTKALHDLVEGGTR